jgi:hypothetical protein
MQYQERVGRERGGRCDVAGLKGLLGESAREGCQVREVLADTWSVVALWEKKGRRIERVWSRLSLVDRWNGTRRRKADGSNLPRNNRDRNRDPSNKVRDQRNLDVAISLVDAIAKRKIISLQENAAECDEEGEISEVGKEYLATTGKALWMYGTNDEGGGRSGTTIKQRRRWDSANRGRGDQRVDRLYTAQITRNVPCDWFTYTVRVYGQPYHKDVLR